MHINGVHFMGVDIVYNVGGGGGGLDSHCARSARKFSALLLKMSKNVLMRRNSHEFGRFLTDKSQYLIQINNCSQ